MWDKKLLRPIFYAIVAGVNARVSPMVGVTETYKAYRDIEQEAHSAMELGDWEYVSELLPRLLAAALQV